MCVCVCALLFLLVLVALLGLSSGLLSCVLLEGIVSPFSSDFLGLRLEGRKEERK